MFTRDEIEAAFRHYQSEVVKAATEANWDLFANLFTEDATYYEHAYGRFEGREAIRKWALKTMSTFPGNAMPGFPMKWYVIDAERGWVICDVRNLMFDPGDGSEHEASNITILHYAGDNQWSYEEDVYNPAKFFEMVTGWARIAEAHGRLPEDGKAWMAKFASSKS